MSKVFERMVKVFDKINNVQNYEKKESVGQRIHPRHFVLVLATPTGCITPRCFTTLIENYQSNHLKP